MSMAASVFEAVKQSVTVRDAAQIYGIEVNRSGMACCPFHDDKNPSMKLNEEFFLRWQKREWTLSLKWK